MRLSHDTLTSAGSAPTKAVVFLHGILGTGVNLRSHARRFVEHRPEYLALLVDLRAHGRSQGLDGADTVAAAARDVVETARGLEQPLVAVVGHSFGGKVALSLVELLPTIERVVTLDSAPGLRLDARGSEATMRVLRVLDSLRGPWKTREAFNAEVEAKGESRSMASWLAMNLGWESDAFRLRLDLSRDSRAPRELPRPRRLARIGARRRSGSAQGGPRHRQGLRGVQPRGSYARRSARPPIGTARCAPPRRRPLGSRREPGRRRSSAVGRGCLRLARSGARAHWRDLVWLERWGRI